MLELFAGRLFVPEVSGASFGQERHAEQLKLKMAAADVTHYLSVLKALITAVPEAR